MQWVNGLGLHPLGRPTQTDTTPRQTPSLGRHPPGRPPHSEMATEAGGTHPTGMHSFRTIFLHYLLETIFLFTNSNVYLCLNL